MLLKRVLWCLLCVLWLGMSSCAFLIEQALKDSGQGQECTTQEDCEDGLLCVYAVQVAENEDEKRGYRCMTACQKSSQCTDSKYNTTCCQMRAHSETVAACFNPDEALCGMAGSE